MVRCQADELDPKSCELAGIVSWGIRCATPDKPGVYTKVAHYTKWIDEVTSQQQNLIILTYNSNYVINKTTMLYYIRNTTYREYRLGNI